MNSLSGLSDTKGPSFTRMAHILQALVPPKSCILMLDLQCDDLIRKMFINLFAVARYIPSDFTLSSFH